MPNNAKVIFRLLPEQKRKLQERMPWEMQDRVRRQLVAALLEVHEAQGDALLRDIDARVVRLGFINGGAPNPLRCSFVRWFQISLPAR